MLSFDIYKSKYKSNFRKIFLVFLGGWWVPKRAKQSLKKIYYKEQI